MMIAVSTREMRTAFNHHDQSSRNGDNPSHYLILFYAVECGLKYAYMRKNGLTSTSTINPAILNNYGHDLHFWIACLKIPAQILQPPSQYHYKTKEGLCNLSELHQAWRYGVHIQDVDQNNAITALNELRDWIKENCLI